MAIATDTTQGEIVLTGDLYGTAGYPQLRPTGVTPDVYDVPQVVVDAKGRVIYAREMPQEDVEEFLNSNVPDATTTTRGIVSTPLVVGVRANLLIDDGVLSVKKAEVSGPGPYLYDGAVQVGQYFLIEEDGTLNANPPVPYAGTTTVGKVVVPAAGRIIVDADGKISIPLSSSDTYGVVRGDSAITTDSGLMSFVPSNMLASVTALGFVKVGPDLNISGGELRANAATTTTYGVVQVGTNLNVTSGVISIPDATTTSLGAVQVGDGLSVVDGILTIQHATTAIKGIVQIGENLNASVGVMSIREADTTTKGAVQVGTNLNVTDGVVSIPEATTTSLGAVQVGTNLNVTSGVISIPDATTTIKGVVQVGFGLMMENDSIGVDLDSFYATTTTKGVVQVGTNLNVTDGVVSIPEATTTSLGVVQIGGGVASISGSIRAPYYDSYYGPGCSSSTPAFTRISDSLVYDVTWLRITNGTLHVRRSSETQLGTVKIGQGINQIDGVISVPEATTTSKGVVQVGSNLSVSNGVISAPNATTTTKGIVRPGQGFLIDDGVISTIDATTTTRGVIGVQPEAGLSVTDGVLSGFVYDHQAPVQRGFIKIGSSTEGFYLRDTNVLAGIKGGSQFGIVKGVENDAIEISEYGEMSVNLNKLVLEDGNNTVQTGIQFEKGTRLGMTEYNSAGDIDIRGNPNSPVTCQPAAYVVTPGSGVAKIVSGDSPYTTHPDITYSRVMFVRDPGTAVVIDDDITVRNYYAHDTTNEVYQLNPTGVSMLKFDIWDVAGTAHTCCDVVYFG